jgi:hypothetical protein
VGEGDDESNFWSQLGRSQLIDNETFTLGTNTSKMNSKLFSFHFIFE